MKKLKYIGIDAWDRPVYKDESGILWKDVNLGSTELYLHNSSNNEFDGEPDMPIKETFEIIADKEEKDNKFQFMMLSMLRSRCDYYLGFGNRNPNIFGNNNPSAHIEEMKKIWNSFADTEKPEWLTWEQILNYEKEICGGNNTYYYELHIFLGRNDGYSKFFKSDKQLENEEDIIAEALKLMPDLDGDIDMCDYAKKITKEEYEDAI